MSVRRSMDRRIMQMCIPHAKDSPPAADLRSRCWRFDTSMLSDVVYFVESNESKINNKKKVRERFGWWLSSPLSLFIRPGIDLPVLTHRSGY